MLTSYRQVIMIEISKLNRKKTKMTIQNKLTKLREQAGLTQLDMADILNVSVRVINAIEFGKIYPSQKIIALYCEAVGEDSLAF